MIPDSLDFILRPVDDEQAEYASASTKTSATPALSPRGVADTNSPAADVEGASASGAQTSAAEHRQERCPSGPVRSAAGGPRWSAVDDETADLLSLVAHEHPAIPEEEREWDHFVSVLQEVARDTGLIDQNLTRPLLRGEVAPRRVGAFFHRAAKSGLIRAEGWTTSDDREGKNSGRPCRSYRWLGAAS